MRSGSTSRSYFRFRDEPTRAIEDLGGFGATLFCRATRDGGATPKIGDSHENGATVTSISLYHHAEAP